MNEGEALSADERRISRRLVAYADDVIVARPPADVAAQAIASTVGLRWSRIGVWTTALAGTAVVITLLAVLVPQLVNRPINEPAAVTAADEADVLFSETSTCEAVLAGWSVQVTYPAEWSAAGSDDAGCTWFGPRPIVVSEPITQAPEGIAITLGAVPSTPLEGTERRRTEGFVNGHPWTRQIETTTEDGREVNHVVYYIVLDPARDEPTMVAATSTASAGDLSLNVEVLDRLVARLSFPDRRSGD